MAIANPKDFEKIIEEKDREIERLQTEFAEFKQDSAEVENLLESENSEIKKKLDQSEKTCDSLTAKNEASKKEIAGLMKNVENLKKDLEKNQGEHQILKKKLVDLEQLNDELNNKLRSMQSELEETQEKLLQIEEEFVILKEDRDEMEKTKNEEITLLKEEIKEINEEFKTKLHVSEEKNAALMSSAEKNNNNASASTSSSKYEKKESMYNYVDLRSKYLSEIDELKDEIENLKKEYKSWQMQASVRTPQINQNIVMGESPIDKLLFKEKEKERKSRISSYFSKNALDKMVQEIQSSELMKKKASLYSEKAIVDYKKTNEVLAQENKRLTELVERIKSETNKNKEFIINNIKELERNHQSQLDKLVKDHENQIQDLQRKYFELERDYAILQKNVSSLSITPAHSSNTGGGSKLKFSTAKTLKSEDEIGFSAKSLKKIDRCQIFLYMKGAKAGYKGCPYIDIKDEETIMIARITQNGLDRNQINKNLNNGTLMNFDKVFSSIKKMEEKMVDLTQLSKKNRAFIIYGPKKTHKKNIQIFILENLIHNIKKYLKSIENTKSNEKEVFTLTLKYDSYTTDRKRKIKPYTLNVDYKVADHENVLKQFELIFDELKKNFLAKTNEKEENSNIIRVFEIFLTNNTNNEKNLSFLVISSNKIKGSLKKNDTLLSNIEDILKMGNESERSFNSNNLQIYEKILIVCVYPNLENFKVTYDTLNISNSLQRREVESRSKSKNPEANGSHDNSQSQESLSKLKNFSLDCQIMKEKISRKNREIVELRKMTKDLENEKNAYYKKIITLENNNQNMKLSFKKLLLNIKKITNESIHKQSRRKLTRVPTNTKLERQTNFIQKLIDHSEYLNLFKITQEENFSSPSDLKKIKENQNINENEEMDDPLKQNDDQVLKQNEEKPKIDKIASEKKMVPELTIETKNFNSLAGIYSSDENNKIGSFEDDDEVL